MYPVLFGPYSTGTVLWGVGALLGVGMGAVLAGRDGHGIARSVTALALCAVVMLVGAKVHFLVANWGLVQAGGLRAYLGGGFHLPGGLLAVTLMGPLVLLMLRQPVLTFGDSVAPAAALGIAVVRLGCFANGCCVGGIRPAPSGVAFPPGSRVYQAQLVAGLIAPGAPTSLPVLPLGLFFALVALATAAVLHRCRRHRRFAGQLVLAGLALWASTTAALELLRDQSSLAGAPHLFEVAAVAAGILVPLLAFLTYRHWQERLPLRGAASSAGAGVAGRRHLRPPSGA